MNRSRLDVGELLTAVEDAPPVAAADAVAGLLERMMGALDVTLLIADFSGEALVVSDAGANG